MHYLERLNSQETYWIQWFLKREQPAAQKFLETVLKI